MPRKYIRKKERTYTIETLQRAVQEIKDKKTTLRQAEEKYGVPRATLFDQVKKGATTIPKRGKKSVFNETQESQLVEFILKSCKVFFAVTIPTLRKIAFDFATANNIKHDFNKDTRMAGMDWYYNFMARHPNISFRRPKATSLNKAFNRSTSIDKARKGFKSAGICLTDADKFKGTFANFSDIIASEIPLDNRNTNIDHSSQRKPHNKSQLICDAANDSILSQTGSQGVSQFSSNAANVDYSNQIIPANEVCTDDVINDADLSQSMTSQTSQSSLVPLNGIVKIPTLQPNRCKRLVRKKHSVIFTSTSEKVNLEEKEQKRIERKRKNLTQEKKNTINKKQEKPKNTGRKMIKRCKKLA